MAILDYWARSNPTCLSWDIRPFLDGVPGSANTPNMPNVRMRRGLNYGKC